jgi:methylenetetrahydrofolate reductase (NADPH)
LRAFTKSETEHVLIDLNFMGINNYIGVAGRRQQNESVFRPEPDGHAHANELVSQIVDLEQVGT